MARGKLQPIVAQGRNCWRIARADKAAVIVDAADYYRIIAAAMELAQKRIFIVGWDFDTRIALAPDTHGKGETLGRFFLRLAREKPERQIDILKWNFGALKQFFHATSVVWLWRWERTKAIDFRFDASHPVGCSHHQKIVVIDSRLAACGGIDISADRWDTSAHLDDDPHRVSPGGQPYRPWHDATMLMQGEVADHLSELGRERWKIATHAELTKIEPCDQQWPAELGVMFENVDVAIARTRAAYDQLPEVREIEALYLDMIAATKRFLYIENQYFTSAKIAAAIAKRMAEVDPPEIVLVMPRTGDGWLEQKAMDAARIKLVAAIGRADKTDRFRVYVPVTKGGTDIYVHAKIAIVDDRLLRVGSANLNNRSQGLDSECDVIIDAALPANHGSEGAMTELRHRLIAEHIDCTPEKIAAEEQARGSMVDAIEALRGSGKTLELLTMEELGDVEEFIADNELLDPKGAEAMFEPIGKRGLAQNWTRGRAMIGARLARRRGLAKR
ncbi:MAG: phospholipase D-like domain-containing protein [Pseudomonadota bacterium]|nr:phospholipase D-like domain-containing protein [Pseudomonadota bacterium]